MKTRPKNSAFTLLELMTVLAVIVILTAMVVGIAGMVQSKAAKSRTTAEIKMLEVAIDAYKGDLGGYPETDKTNLLSPRKDFQPSKTVYTDASLDLYRELTGDKKVPCDGKPDDGEPIYLKEFDPRILKKVAATSGSSVSEIKYLQDPFGYPYGYSTAGAKVERQFIKDLRKNPKTERKAGKELEGYNAASYDLWSTVGNNTEVKAEADEANEQAKWIKNW